MKMHVHNTPGVILPQLMTVAEVAAVLRKSPDRVRDLVNSLAGWPLTASAAGEVGC